MLWSALADNLKREAFIDAIIALYADPSFITNHPAIVWKSLDGVATLTAQADADDVGNPIIMSSIAETGTYASSEFSFERHDWSASLHYVQVEMSTDLATNAQDRINLPALARTFVLSEAATMTKKIVETAATFSTTYKDASAAATAADDLWDALAAFEAATNGAGGLCTLHPSAVQDLMKDTLFVQESNAAVNAPELAALRSFYGTETFVTRIKGVDILQSKRVPLASGKRANAIFRKGGLGIATKTPVAQDPRHQILGRLRVLAGADAEGPSGTVRAETYLGSGIIVDALGGLFLTRSV